MALTKLGIKETKEGLALVYAIVNATGRTLQNGKVSLTDLPHWFPVSAKVGPAVDNFKAIWPELKDLSKSESDELLRWTQQELDIPQDQVEHWLELAVGVLLRLVELYSMHLAARQIKARALNAKGKVYIKDPKPFVAKKVEEKKQAAKESVKESVSDVAKSDVSNVAKEAEESFVSKAKKKVSRRKKKA